MPMCIAGLKLLVSRITFIYLLNQFHKQNFKELNCIRGNLLMQDSVYCKQMFFCRHKYCVE